MGPWPRKRSMQGGDPTGPLAFAALGRSYMPMVTARGCATFKRLPVVASHQAEGLLDAEENDHRLDCRTRRPLAEIVETGDDDHLVVVTEHEKVHAVGVVRAFDASMAQVRGLSTSVTDSTAAWSGRRGEVTSEALISLRRATTSLRRTCPTFRERHAWRRAMPAPRDRVADRNSTARHQGQGSR